LHSKRRQRTTAANSLGKNARCDLTDRKVQASLKDKQIAEIIKNGKAGTGMPPFADKLSDRQIQSLVTYIRSLKK
jgi:mono/diheme cytochrome c family protein